VKPTRPSLSVFTKWTHDTSLYGRVSTNDWRTCGSVFVFKPSIINETPPSYHEFPCVRLYISDARDPRSLESGERLSTGNPGVFINAKPDTSVASRPRWSCWMRVLGLVGRFLTEY
jgi:hypothetical protein